MVGYKRSREGGRGCLWRVQGARRAGLEPESLVGQLDAGEGRRMRSGAGRLMNLLSIASRLSAKSQKAARAASPRFSTTRAHQRRR